MSHVIGACRVLRDRGSTRRPTARTTAGSTACRAARPPSCARRSVHAAVDAATARSNASSSPLVDGDERRAVGRGDALAHRERTARQEHLRGDGAEVVERHVLVGDARLLLEALHHRVVEMALGREVAVHGALTDAGAFGDGSEGELLPVPAREAVHELRAGAARCARASPPPSARGPACRTVRRAVRYGRGAHECAVQLRRVLDVVGELGPHLVEIEPEAPRGSPGPTAHGSRRSAPTTAASPDSNASLTGSPSHVVEPTHLADRIGLHGAEVDVVEPVVGAAVAEGQHALHAESTTAHVQPTDVLTVHVVGEDPDHVGVHVGDRQHHVGGIAVASSRSARPGTRGRVRRATARARAT